MTISQLFLKVTYTFLRRKLDVQRIRDLRKIMISLKSLLQIYFPYLNKQKALYNCIEND